jgi:acetyl-CoA carboxylase biotin carboxyl carrier protein
MGQPKSKRAPDAAVDLAAVRELLALMGEHDLAELAFEQGDLKVSLKKAGAATGPPAAVPIAGLPVVANPAPAAPAPAAPEAAEPEAETDGLQEISSPMVGTYYAAADPDSPPFVEVGQQVSEGTVVCIIEAMKVMNEIKAECRGTIEKVLVRNGEAVEYGQALFRVRPD